MKKIMLYLVACVFLVSVSYYFIDQPLAKILYDSHLAQIHLFKWATYIPNLFVYLSMLALFIMFSRQKINLSKNHLQVFIIAISLSSYITLVLVKLLKIVFGRIGPEYWSTHQSDLHAYGFYWLQGNASNYQDFPSGHTAVMFAMLAIVWRLASKLRWVGTLLSLLIIIALLCTQSHFLADCIAGAFVGWIVGQRTLRFLL